MMVAAVREAPGTGTGAGAGAGAGMEQLKQVKSFPAGLRVLVVDDDPTCLKILDRMLKKCEYEVTTCTRGNDALTLLRGKRNSFDLVISDVYMPDLDGFELLERVGLEMDLPVIMMSADGGTNTVMKGIKHGACDYLIKPVRLEELQNIWQHVIRKKRTSSKDFEHSVGSFEENDKNKRGSDDLDYTSSANEGGDANWKMGKKRKENKEEEDDGEQDPDDPSASKKPRVVWSVELHQQFVNAVNQLGIDKAVPKRILELMHVQGLTRENVASHLQKYRLYLKRLSGVTQQQNGMGSSFGGPDHMGPMGLLGRYDMTGYGPSGQISPQTLAGIPAELIGRVNTANSLGIANVDRSLLLQASLQDSSSNLNRRFPPLMNSQGNLLQGFPNLETKQFPSVQQQHNPSFVNDAANPGFCVPPQLNMTTAAGGMDQSRLLNSNEAINPQKDALLMQFMHQRQQRQQPCQQQQQLPASVIQQASFGQLKSSQLQNGQMNFSSAGLAGMTAVPNDSRARNSLLPSSNGRGSLNNNITLISSTEDLNRSSANLNVNSTELSVSGGVSGISSTDYKSRSIPLINATEYAVSSASGVSAYPAASVDMESAIAIQGMKKMGSANELLTSSSMGSSGLAFGRPNNIDQVSSENSRQNWQLQNTPVTPDSGQAAAFPSPRGSQNLNAASMQDAAHIRNYGFVQKGSGFPSRFTQNAVPRMFNSVQNVNEQSDVDGRRRVKEEGVPDFILNGKSDPINFAEPYSDDLMSILLRQHPQSFQEGDFQEGDFQSDSF